MIYFAEDSDDVKYESPHTALGRDGRSYRDICLDLERALILADATGEPVEMELDGKTFYVSRK